MSIDCGSILGIEGDGGQLMEDTVALEVAFFRKEPEYQTATYRRADWSDDERLSYYLNNFFRRLLGQIRERWVETVARLGGGEEAVQKILALRQMTPLQIHEATAKNSLDPKSALAKLRAAHTEKFLNTSKSAFMADIDDAIRTSGVNPAELELLQSVCASGGHPTPVMERDIILPIFIEMRKKGYSRNDLAQ